MSQNVKLIRAFIASPGGLDEERRAARDAAEEVNSTVAKQLGYRLELYGWEDTISGVGRPQDIINAELETCDLFVGAMWTKWGSKPSLEGPFTSGFEEEFELARKRCRQMGSPEMAMFFKDIPEQQLADPGLELAKVLAFRQRLVEEKELLFQPFVTSDEFAQRVRAFLAREILRRYQKDLGATQEEQESSKAVGPSTSTAATELPDAASRVVEAEFLGGFTEQLRLEGMAGRNDLESRDVARIRLIGAALGRVGNDEMHVGVHDANLIYADRGKEELSRREISELIGCALSQVPHENVPLWSWLTEAQRPQNHTLDFFSALGVDEDRAGALTVMRWLRQPLRTDKPPEESIAASYWLSDDAPASARIAALNYLRDLGTPNYVELVRAEIAKAKSDTASAAIEALLGILLRQEPAAAAKALIDSSFETLSGDPFKSALQALEQLPSEDLQRALDHRSAQVRARALRLLGQRGDAQSAILTRATDDASALVRSAAVEILDQIGAPLSLQEAAKVFRRPRPIGYGLLRNSTTDPEGERYFETYARKRLSRIPINDVRELAKSNSTFRDTARFVLADRLFHEEAPILRHEVDDQYAVYINEKWPNGLKREPFSGLAALLIGPDPAVAKRRELMQAALDLLAKHRDPVDLSRVRAALDEKMIRSTAAISSYISSFGGWEDISRLASVAEPRSLGLLDDDERRQSLVLTVSAILKLGSSSLRELLRLALPPLVLAETINQSTQKSFGMLQEEDLFFLLLHDSDAVRRAAARKAVISFSKSRIAVLLNAYLNQDYPRYYNVLFWLDLGVAYSKVTAKQVISASQRY